MQGLAGGPTGATTGAPTTTTRAPTTRAPTATASEAMNGLNIMDSTIIPDDMRDNLVSIAAQQVAGSGETSAVNNFNMPIKEFYAVRAKSLNEDDKTSLNKNNVPGKTGIDSAASNEVTVLTSVTGNIQVGIDGDMKKQALKVLQLTREAIASEVETDRKSVV